MSFRVCGFSKPSRKVVKYRIIILEGKVCLLVKFESKIVFSYEEEDEGGNKIDSFLPRAMLTFETFTSFAFG